MVLLRDILFLSLFLSGYCHPLGSEDVDHHSAHRLRYHKSSRKHRAANEGKLRFEPEPYSRKLELNSSGKIHCKVAGGVSPKVQWFLNEEDALPDGVTSSNGTLVVSDAARRHAGHYTCRAVDGDNTITSKISLDIVVSPRVLQPESGERVHAAVGTAVALHCSATGDPMPTTHWDRNRTMIKTHQNDVDTEDGGNASTARILMLNNGTLLIRNATEEDSDRYGCIAGNAAGLARNELVLLVHPEGEMPASESTGVGSKAVVVSISVAGAYMLLVLALMLYCRLNNRQRAEKEELEMAEGREKLVDEPETERKANGVAQNGRLLTHDRDSGADNSEVSGISRASKKSGHYDHLTVPRSLLTDQITLGRGEFGEVSLAKIDLNQVKKLRNKDHADTEPKIIPVLVKALTTKDEAQLAEFRRQLDLFGRVRHETLVRLVGLSNEMEPHCMLLEHTDWGDLKNFLLATRTEEENMEYAARVGEAHSRISTGLKSARPLAHSHRVLLATRLAAGLQRLAAHRLTHRDVSARNCVITSSLSLKLSLAALSRGPDCQEYFKLHDQVIPLRWLPAEAVLEGEYSTKSDVYMFAATVWEIYTKAELPFAKLNDNSVLERLKAGTLEWVIPSSMPDAMAALLNRCWSKSPSDRPQFTEICDELAAILKTETANSAKETENNEDIAA